MVFKLIFGLFSILTIILLMSGCSSTQQTAPQITDAQRNLSLEHFIAGSALDQKGDFAKAILEYQDALQLVKDPAIYIAIAKDYSMLGKHQLAMQSGQEAVKLKPENRTYRQTLAEIYLNAFAFEDALKEYEQITKIEPSFQDAWLSLARLQQLRGPEKAIETYNEIIQRFDPNADVYLQMAQIYGATGKYNEASEALKKVLNIDQGNYEISKALGDLYLRQDSVEKALKIFNDLAERKPDDVLLRAAMAHAYLLQQNYNQASAQFNIVMKKDTLSADEQIKFGQVFVSFIEKDSAVAPYAQRLFEEMKTYYPDDWRIYWFLGAINNIQKRDSLALEYFHLVIQKSKGTPDGWIGAASIYYDNNKFEDAIALLTEAKKYLADEFRIYFLLGISNQRIHRAIEAATALEKAVQLDDKSVEALSALGLVYDELKRFENSDSIYERALRLDPKNHLLLNNYGYSLAEREIELERALKMSKEAVNQQPENQSYLDTYGWIFFRLGNYEEAEKWIKRAVELGSKSSVIYDHLGDIYFKLSDKEKASEWWQKALEIDPTNESLKNKIQRGNL
ncbi:MAG: tetratricopeptide repeat protein [Ignavibacteriales bacterium]|nr:tetratricopeptide repeat protein [Ignavibacteriales bacterium]